MQDGEFLEVFTAHLDRLYNLARGLTSSTQDAEDLVQETCLLALRGWRRQPPRDPAAWFATICLNSARSDARRRGARPVEVSADDWLAALPADSDTERAALAAVESEQVRAALGRLPAVQREAIVLMDLSGYTAAETAGVLGCPRGTVLARVHRGRKALALLMADGARQVRGDDA